VNTPSLVLEAQEQQKSKQQQAEDIAYTINHSLYCTLTDFLNPPINAATDGYLRWLIPGCGHDHSHDDGACSHHHAPLPANASRWEKVKMASRQAFSKERFIDYAQGEFIGDFGAVPLTIGVQRLFPDLMHGLRKLCEPAMQPLFMWGVKRDTKKWAQTNHVAEGSAQYREHAAKLYEYEMEHFPQAVIWTGFSLGLNTAYQVWADKTPMAFSHKLALKSGSVLSGVLVTAGVVVAARAMAPASMHGFDQWMSKNAILPATKKVGEVFGINEEDVERMAEKHESLQAGSWEARMHASQSTFARNI
jgi:hypothetical protein